MASANGDNSPGPEIGRLQSTFITSPYQSHPAKWDSLWKESYTPWDRGGPSLALADLVTSHPNLFPAPTGAERKKALVPGCGRGYDAVLLSVLGYDVVGLDYSSVAVEEARSNEGKMAGEGVWEDVTQEREKGSVTWVQGDFFHDGWLQQTGMGKGGLDLIFDYTVRVLSLLFILS
jgi:SAM-dependent methyltransferase